MCQIYNGPSHQKSHNVSTFHSQLIYSRLKLNSSTQIEVYIIMGMGLRALPLSPSIPTSNFTLSKQTLKLNNSYRKFKVSASKTDKGNAPKPGKQNLFESVTEALDFAQVRSAEDAVPTEEAKSKTRSGEHMSTEQMGDQGYAYTLDEALSTIGFGRFQFGVLAYSGLGWIAEAMEMMLLSFVGPAIQPEWGLSSNQESLISTVAFAGMLVGAYSWGVVSDSYGRKKGFLGSAIITGVAGLLSAFAPNYISLLILRCIVGVGIGCGHVFSSWFLEFVPTPNRGSWMVVFSTFWTVGTIMEASLAWWIMPTYGWRWLLGLSAVPSLVALLCYDLVPESPRYLCSQGRLTEAQYILANGATLNCKDLPKGLLVSDHINESTNEGLSSESTTLLSSTKNESNNFKRKTPSIVMLLSPNLARTTLLLWLLYFGNTFSYYGIVLLTSQLSIGQSECDPTTIQSTNIEDPSLYVNVFITSLAELPGLALAALILDKVGRKISMEIMLVGGFLLLLPLVVHQNAILTTGLLFGARMFISAGFIVVCIYSPEVYPTKLRATGVGIATAIGRIGGMVCPLIAVGMGSNCHQTLPVILFEVVILLSGLTVMLLPFETSGKDLSDNLDLPVQHVEVK